MEQNKHEAMQETDKKHCKKCNQMKTRIQDGTYDGKNKKWRDEEGKLWNGRVCPTCQVAMTRENMQKMRKKVKEDGQG